MSAPASAPVITLLCWRDLEHPQGGGSERYIQRVGAELARRGARVTLLTAAFPGCDAETVVDGVRIIRRGGRLSVYPRALLILAGARLGIGPLRGIFPDVVVDTQNGVPFFASLLTRRVVVLVHHCHREQWPVAGPVLSRIGWWIESRLSPWAHRHRRYVTVSAPSRDELVGLGVDPTRISVVRAGIDPPHAVDVAADEYRIVALSRLVPHKQVEHALGVVAALRTDIPDLTLDVVGGGWWGDRLRAHAEALDIADRVHFHGHVSEARKHELLASAHVHLMPSRKEGWGIAVIEAAQHGVPTIGYRCSAGLTDSIEDGVTGLLVDGPAELAAATRELLENPDEARSLGTAAREAAAGYSWSATADGFTAVFEQVLAPR
ncbi:glycosyltransferase family 4 protein [Gordonia crocea]|uniref:Putative glycosyl transferase n=1 Tax=Gordonia crocea TaxID=589162 RepID=A0A7M3STS6_9ACTN|nr:glycosyltransferase family 4 protein [Gordonia crocea]GED96050.1 putative glycosyl transferase [Gordonia crocea]GED98958.1 putative glycosyl transferase [Gordonia crocea]